MTTTQIHRITRVARGLAVAGSLALAASSTSAAPAQAAPSPGPREMFPCLPCTRPPQPSISVAYGAGSQVWVYPGEPGPPNLYAFLVSGTGFSQTRFTQTTDSVLVQVVDWASEAGGPVTCASGYLVPGVTPHVEMGGTLSSVAVYIGRCINLAHDNLSTGLSGYGYNRPDRVTVHAEDLVTGLWSNTVAINLPLICTDQISPNLC